jgi:hypothetical protein
VASTASIVAKFANGLKELREYLDTPNDTPVGKKMCKVQLEINLPSEVQHDRNSADLHRNRIS